MLFYVATSMPEDKLASKSPKDKLASKTPRDPLEPLSDWSWGQLGGGSVYNARQKWGIALGEFFFNPIIPCARIAHLEFLL